MLFDITGESKLFLPSAKGRADSTVKHGETIIMPVDEELPLLIVVIAFKLIIANYRRLLYRAQSNVHRNLLRGSYLLPISEIILGLRIVVI